MNVLERCEVLMVSTILGEYQWHLKIIIIIITTTIFIVLSS